LLAVVFTESGCEPVATSTVGARGLWQFMPDAGRAYHLRIIKDALDERLSPPKETDAAIGFLADLYKKFGAWDLAFAAYNMGPFGLMARLQRVEPGGGFWDLVDADVLPDETANYVPQIQAYALILANLQKLKFVGSQMKAPEVTSDLDVPPGTRIGLVARAASTTVSQIRGMNLDILGDRVPAVPGERFSVQVPKDVVWQARETLAGLIAQGNNEDECVPDSFDWGKRRFTPEMSTECRQRLAAPR
ncbi:MAG TPA: lytic transglycosylase domain-containing protein, partial [Polyangiaceae bacterium]